MNNVIDINKLKPHSFSEVICINCKHRWIAVFQTGTWLKDLECPECKKIGFVISTGQEIKDEITSSR